MTAKRFFETTLEAGRIDDLSASGGWPNRLLDDQISKWTAERSSEPVITDRFGTMTWGEFGAEVDAASKGLLEIGVRPGVIVQLQLPNWRHFVVAAVACDRIGAVVNPVAPIFRHNEVTVMSELGRPMVVISADSYRGFGLAQMHAELRERCEWVAELVVVPGPSTSPSNSNGDESWLPADAMTWEDLIEEGRFSSYDRAAVDLCRPGPNDVCEMMFTSGTTGLPKGVMHTHNILEVAVDAFLDTVCEGLVPHPGAGASQAYVSHMASTLGHQTGYLYGMRLPLHVGGHVVMQDVWDPVEFVGLIEKHRIQLSMGATPFLADVLGVESLTDHDLSSWQRFLCAGAAIPRPVLERAIELLPDCTVMPGWGMTECGLLTVGMPDDPLERRLTDGRAVRDNEVRVVDEAGESVLDTEGDLQCRGTALFAGYMAGREFTAQHWPDGWFDTGDRAIMDADGYISIAGRSKDLVIRGGENVPVREIEDALLRHPAVGVVAIVAKPHERLGETGCAFVQPVGDPPTLADLTDFLDAQNVTRQFWPEDLVIVDEFPMTPSGKIQKYRLRDSFG
ncbi:AMP-binding protein [Candidatus Poriferisodalis sp.]|uniref:AMP-binding protein n=1 Tax=Candidatus Poriferisodalis sp. TaxID=3101277 RepID=UPI003B5CBC51